jgi:hypothetical protein
MTESNKDANAIKDKRKAALNAGLWVFMMLAVLTAGEFIVGVIAPPWTQMLLIVAAFKAFFVVKDYMHIGRLFSEEDSH